MSRALGAVCAVGLVLGSAMPIAAQQTAELTGTYVRYVAVSSSGVMVANDAPDGRDCMDTCHCDDAGISCVEGRGMRYSEDGTAAASTCDAFYPRSTETFTIVAARSDGATLSGHNDLGFAPIVGVEGPTLADRGIHWAGVLNDPTGNPAIRVEHDWDYQPDDRTVRLTTTLTNVSTSTLSEVYLLRNADPNFVGLCPASGTGSGITSNDVLRQPPTGGDALVIAGAGDVSVSGAHFVLGIGAHDDRARVTVTGHENSDAVGEWNTPHDPNGTMSDVAIDLIFHEPEIAPGDSATFELFYVWGTTSADVEARFDTVGAGGSTCLGVVDGVGCSSSTGLQGICHASSCCTGCWDAADSRCQLGTASAHCGALGAACVSCSDGIDCTSDVCGLGLCSNPPAPVATRCEDGAFCTVGETCDGLGHCGGSRENDCDDAASCTADTCDEVTDRCDHALTSGCLVGGECVASGVRPTAYPCLVCDAARSTTDWSSVDTGESCGMAHCAAGAMFEGGTCDDAGACVAPHPTVCPSGVCLADQSACEEPCTPTSCPAGTRCAPAMHCVALADDGAVCASNDECSSSHCADGVCCTEACDGLCAACDLPHQMGHCTGVPASTDPARECAGDMVCDGHGACTTPMPDAGRSLDAAVRADADAGNMGPDAHPACSCTAPGRSSRGAGGGLAVAMLGVLAWVRRRRARLAASMFFALALAIPSVALATTLTGGGGFLWDVDDRVGGGGDITQGTSDAYDSCYYLTIGATRYAVPTGTMSTLSADGRQVDLPPMVMGSGLLAERHIYAPATENWARFIEVITNTSGSAVATTVTITGGLGSDSTTSLVATSSGDAMLDTADTWFTTDDADASGDPSLAHVFRGAGGAVSASTVTLAVDAITYTYGVMIPAHGRVVIMHFAVQAMTRALAQTGAQQISLLGPETRIGADVWASSIVNWAIGWADTCASDVDGASCSSWATMPGHCHGSTCCVGCWTGTFCDEGSTVSTCGAGGGVCSSCSDGNVCTDDVCMAGACSNPAARISAVCDDGAFCTSNDHCDGSGGCTPGAATPCNDHVSCTIDACDEASDACSYTFSTGCTIGGECVGTGDHHVAYPCLVCDPTRDPSDWSTETAGVVCGSARCAGGHLFSAGTCDATGTCNSLPPSACESMACALDGMTCEDVCTATSCPAGSRCGAERHCIPVRSLGSDCTTDDQCVTGKCADGVCCDQLCEGTCASCDLPGNEGTCRMIPAGTDPAGECGPTQACDGHGVCVSHAATDAGRADAMVGDVGPRADTGATPMPPAASCQCAVGSRPGPSGAWMLLGVALLVLRRRAAW